METPSVAIGGPESIIEGHPPAGPVEIQLEPEPPVAAESEPAPKPRLRVHRPESEPQSVVDADLEIEFTENLLAKMFANLAAHGMTLEDLAG